ncbi:MAG: hypothetical protein KIS88_07425 [Anaerolineales bacterium]|nr:hypothetical protein [Anaerolineales bacterium]
MANSQTYSMLPSVHYQDENFPSILPVAAVPVRLEMLANDMRYALLHNNAPFSTISAELFESLKREASRSIKNSKKFASDAKLVRLSFELCRPGGGKWLRLADVPFVVGKDLQGYSIALGIDSCLEQMSLSFKYKSKKFTIIAPESLLAGRKNSRKMELPSQMAEAEKMLEVGNPAVSVMMVHAAIRKSLQNVDSDLGHFLADASFSDSKPDKFEWLAPAVGQKLKRVFELHKDASLSDNELSPKEGQEAIRIGKEVIRDFQIHDSQKLLDSRFEIVQEGRGYYFFLRTGSALTVVSGGEFSSKNEVRQAIKSLIVSSANDDAYIRGGTESNHFFTIRAKDHSVLATSNKLHSRPSRDAQIEIVKEVAAVSPIKDMTP